MEEESKHLSIAAVARQTGIAKEVLRKWETRYGFPVPERDETGNRVYPSIQLARLQLIKRLLDDGMRPGQVVGMDQPGLEALAGKAAQPGSDTSAPQADGGLIDCLQSRDPAKLRAHLLAAISDAGLESFVSDLMPAMNEAVGQAWSNGAIAVRDEHLYSEAAQDILRRARAAGGITIEGPRVLLTTPEGELHTLGLLMAETLLALRGADCISLGVQSPLAEIAAAAGEFGVDVVALSFSVSFPKRKIVPILKSLRAALPKDVALWAGGAGVAGLASTPRGVQLMPALTDIDPALQRLGKRSGPGR